ncbi:TPA: hypothetical protein ACGO4H_001089 [Streptococcus suis]
MKAKNRRRIGYSVIEQYNSLVFLKDFLEDKKLEGYLATLNKSIDEVHRLSISEQQKIINLFPVNIPQIGGDFPKGQNNSQGPDNTRRVCYSARKSLETFERKHLKKPWRQGFLACGGVVSE